MTDVGFDMHGVLTELPQILHPILKMMRDSGHRIHILSGPSKLNIMRELGRLGYIRGVHYDYIFSITDHLILMGVPTTKGHTHSNPLFPDNDWWASKGKYCKWQKIMHLFDDSPRYNDHDYLPPFTKFYLIGGGK